MSDQPFVTVILPVRNEARLALTPRICACTGWQMEADRKFWETWLEQFRVVN